MFLCILLYLLYLSQTDTGTELSFASDINGVLIRYVVGKKYISDPSEI